MTNVLKRIISALIIISSVIQLIGLNLAFAAGEEYKDPYKNIYISEYDGEDVYLPADFGYNNGFGSNTQTGHYVSWKNVKFNETPVSVELSYGTMHSGAVAEIRLDSVLGPVIATFTPEPTGRMYTEGFVEVNVQNEVTGVHDLYFIFKNNYLNIKYFKFKKYGEDNLGYTLFEGMSDDAIYDDVNTNELSYEIKLLNKLGMLDFIQDTKFDGKKIVTKGEFAQAMCAFYTDKVDAGQTYFYDLPSGHSMSKYVNYAYQKGLFDMPNDMHFRPESTMTIESALKVIKKFFNLPEFDNEIIANTEKNLENKILSGVRGKLTNELSRDNLVRMITNALEATYIKYKVGNDGIIQYYFTEGILKDTRNIDKTYGLVNAVPATSLSNVESGLSMGEVLIGDAIYNDPKNLAQQYLGYNCVVFYENINDELHIQSIYPRSNVSELIIDTTIDDEVLTFSEQKIEYLKSDIDKTKKINFSKSTYFIYNGKAIDESIDKFVNVDTFQGKIRVIDNKDCFVVLIDEYQNALLKCVDSSEFKYIDKITDTLIDLSDTNTSVFKNSKPIMNSDIPAESAVYIYRSKNTIGSKITRIVILPDNQISGVITSRSDDKITIESNEYKIAKENTKTYSVGIFATFILNTHGEIIWSEALATDELQIGIFLGHHVSEDEETLSVKLFTKEGGIEKFECTSKFILDGVTCKEINQVVLGKDTYKGLDDVEIRTPVLYMLNEQKQLMVLDTYHEGRKTRYDNLVKVGSEQKYRFSTRSRILIADGTGYGTIPFETNSTLISYWSNLDDSCNAIEPLQNQMSVNYTEIGQAYSTNGNEKIANIFVWKERIAKDSKIPSNFILVDKVIDTLDDDDMPVRAIIGYSGVQKVARYISDQSNVDTTKINRILNNISRGDYIQTTLDPEGNITDMNVIYFFDGESSKNGVQAVLHSKNGGSYRDNNSNNRGLDGILVYCKVIDIQDNYMFVRVGEGTDSFEEVYALTNSEILKVHPRNIETGLSIKEVFNSSSYGSNAVILVKEGIASQIIIYQ